MNHKPRQCILQILVLIGLLLAGCTGRSTPIPNLLSPATETLTGVSEAPSDVEAEEPTPLPSATLAPPPPTPTLYPSATPVPTIEFPELSGDYLGQEPPGLTPVLFAPGIISTGLNVRTIVFAPDGSELYFTPAGKSYSVILWMRQVDGMWMQPEVAPFSGEYNDQDPCFSPDGQRLFFASNRPVEGDGPSKLGLRLFFMEREGTNWGSPQSVGEVINQGNSQFLPSVAADGTLYFTATYPDGEGYWDIYRSRLVNKSYQPPESLGTNINGSGYEGVNFIAPDQSYLLLGRDGATYYSLRQDDGTWTDPKNLSNDLAINNNAWGVTLSPDGKFIFIATKMYTRLKLPSEPPGFDAVREWIDDDQKIESLFQPDIALEINLNIYWISSKVLPFLGE